MITNSNMSRTIRTLLILLLLNVLFIANTHGEQKIMGAFGIQLGDYFDTSSAIGTGELEDGTPMYQFSPEKKFRSFDDYYVLITPKTHKIYGIWGIGTAENSQKCEKEQALIMDLLKKKYGVKEKEGFFDPVTGAKNIDQGNRDVTVKCSGFRDMSFVDMSINIRYYDRELKKLAEEERLEIVSSKVDDSGL
jgi:hypothetical protein